MKSFLLNRTFVRKLAELYHDDKMLWFRIFSEERKRDVSDGNHEPMPFSKTRIENHITQLIKVAFWASLEMEERRYHEFTLTYSRLDEPGLTDRSFVFADLPLNPRNVVKLAPALQSSGGMIVGPKQAKRAAGNELHIRGFGPSPLRGATTSLVIGAIGPGRLILSHADNFKAAVHGDQIEYVDERSLELFHSLFGWPERTDLVNEELIIQTLRRGDPKTIALALRAHAHGGALLIVPNGHEGWKSSIQMDRLRFLGIPYDGIKRDLEERDQAWGKSNMDVAFERAQRSLKSLAQLTAVDGAAVVSYDLSVLAFGAEIRPVAHNAGPGHRSNKLDFALVSLPFEKSKQRKVPLADLGGTRHKSAAQFVFDQKDVDPRAIVVSSDGGISLYSWDQIKEIVTVTREAEFLLL